MLPFLRPQEKPNDIPEGETPHAVVLHVYEANVDVCRYKCKTNTSSGHVQFEAHSHFLPPT